VTDEDWRGTVCNALTQSPCWMTGGIVVGERPLAADATGGGGTGPGVGIHEDGVLVQRRHHDQQAVLSLYGIPYQRCQRALTQVQQDGLLLQEMLIPDCS